MWNPFKKLTRSSISETMGFAKPIPIQIQIIAALEEMLDSLDAQTLPPPMRQVLPVPEDVTALINVGFTGHKKVQDFKKRQKALDNEFNAEFKAYSDASAARNALKNTLKILLKARQIYGPNTLLIPMKQFLQICKKHNLVLGTFDEYTGDIPVEKLQEIKRLREVYRMKEHNAGYKVTTITKTGSGSSVSLEEYQVFNKHFDKRFPILKGPFTPFSRDVKFLDNYTDTFYFMRFEVISSYYFIAAPKEMMSGKIQEVYEPNKDPIIWGLAGDNVLIFTRWGEEANDEVIQRYEAFNRRLDAFAQSLT